MEDEEVCEETPINRHEFENLTKEENDCGARKRFVGLGLIFGALSGCAYATRTLLARILIEYVNAEFIAWIRAMEALVIMLPFVVMKRGKHIFGRSMKEFFILFMMATLNSITMVLGSISLKFIHTADLQTILALAPIFVIIIDMILFCKICKRSNSIIMLICLIGVIMCLQPSFIFGVNVRHDHSFFKGFLICILIAFLRAIIFIAIGYLKDLDIYVKLFWNNAGQIIPLTCYILITKSFEFPSSLKVGIYLLACGIIAILGSSFFILGTSFDSPLVVAIGRTFDIPLSFVYDVFIFHDAFEIWSAFGAILIASSIIGPAIINLYLNKPK